jgi:Na+-transporting methylmalonyl-CoA/oxaloacetate decarboxylase gamma subunit
MKWANRFARSLNMRVAGGAVVVAVLLILETYAMRELLAAEILFAIVFLFVGLIGGVFYLIGGVAERGALETEVKLRPVVPRARQGLRELEEAGRKWLAHSRIASAHR